MLNNYFKTQLERLFEPADISINGHRRWDIQIHQPLVFQRVITEGNLGLGEAYMDCWWDCHDLEEFFFRLLSSKVDEQIVTPAMLAGKWIGKTFNLQRPSRAFTVGKHHYDTGNDLFETMLDKRMIYSCGYWKETEDLDEAQEKKLRLVFDKLQLKPGMHILDIGCGWGGAARFAAEEYGVSVTAITVSAEQARFAREQCKGLPVTIEVTDYRAIQDSFDRIYSIGMFEHVGHKNYRNYFRMINRCLKPDGITLLHTIGSNTPCTNGDPWSCKYIFPNSMLPSASQITKNYEGLFTLEDWHVFTYDYSLTLKAWHENFEKQWPKLRTRYNERFQRMWRYYLLSFSGSFRARSIQLWQILLSKNGLPGRTAIPR
ncbi:cyclopropane fatty acyl phospholipid synthase [Pelodictyon phaeoclathratiforme]|jgi:cyclopropane-fatty-acyl-phospholipid synthase|uniref:Cyclopropane-fatty-acyl-phospholipid synthase n=1 Tax=Pelodictyon phaeoclathratiforme (strain DSM 5477 / BU-1) TaxID=324925 RepID=B4SGQ8_PELPB|nr:cyclopropane fatty acyl phospholipid synthase [Pelodictyon phaeoclathratiforme]ACF43471.1 Cyclopropane-fatty-acyl-phospholipid synthase [Pelodictyon phaeoclathratiforme BU-1]MBV5290185.1 cyclopropane fatty acyl phospholipid synthase [Pelodictyon phaeoclathratiforme]